MLIGNYSVLNKTPGRWFSGGSTAGTNQAQTRVNWNRTGGLRNSIYRDGSTTAMKLMGLPSNYYESGSYMFPYTAGEIGAINTVIGSGDTSATGQSGRNIAATITGDGGVTNAPLGLIVSIAATLVASGGISSASTKALASMVATLTGAGDVTATARGLADLGATIIGSGSVNANNTALMDISATIRGYGDLTPEGLRDAVWNAAAASYNDTGTMGQKLNSAASGGVDYGALADAVWTATTRTLTSGGGGATAEEVATAVFAHLVEAGYSFEEVLRIMAAALAGTVSGAGTGTEVFKGLDGTTNRIISTVDSNGNRTAVTKDGT